MRQPTTSMCHRVGLLAVLLLALVLAACSAPVKVERVSLRTAYEDLNRTALSTDQLSEATRTVLRRAALLDTFDTQPDAAIAALRAQAIATGMHNSFMNPRRRLIAELPDTVSVIRRRFSTSPPWSTPT
jgi:hypothetical protein